MTQARIVGWESRLPELIEEARNLPYSIGRHDCVMFAVRVVRELTGRDFTAQVTGQYNSERSALVFMARLAGKEGLAAAVSVVTGWKQQDLAYTSRGDVVVYTDPEGIDHLGICIGVDVALLMQGGLTFYSISECTTSFNIDQDPNG